MTLKPPTKTFPKLVMKEWPTWVKPTLQKWSADEKSLSDFTRVLEGVEGQKEAPLRKGDRE